MTDEQKQFLQLHLIEQVNYSDISQKLNIPVPTLSKWYKDLKSNRDEISKIMRKFKQDKFLSTRLEFYNWYKAHERKCHYCEITESEIEYLLKNGLAIAKHPTRGYGLEFDRKIPNLKYENLDNIVLCCYWCNNAKTDTFTYEEFKEVGKVFSNIWKKRLAK